MAFSPDGRTLASGSSDNTIILWDVAPQSWAARACRIASRNLSQAEWQQYMGGVFGSRRLEAPRSTRSAKALAVAGVFVSFALRGFVRLRVFVIQTLPGSKHHPPHPAGSNASSCT